MSIIERNDLRELYREYRLLYRACLENGNLGKAKYCAKVSHEIRRAIEADRRAGQIAIRGAY